MSPQAEDRRELEALRRGLHRQRQEAQARPWLASDLGRITQQIQRLERTLKVPPQRASGSHPMRHGRSRR